MGPIDYSIDVQSPFQSALQGYSAGAAMRDDQLKVQQQETALAQQAQQRQVISALISNPNAGAKDYANAALLVPGLKDNFKQAFEMRNADQQQSTIRDIGQYYAAVTSGRPDIAAQQMQARATAMEAAGAPKHEVQALRAQAQIITEHPEFARATMGMLLASVPGGDKVLAGASSAGTEQRAAEKAPAELVKVNAEAGIKTAEAAVAPQKNALDLTNTQSQIDDRSARLGLDRDKLTSDTQTKLLELKQKFGELPEPVMKGINEAAGEAVSSQQSAARMTDLAGQLDRQAKAMPSGATAKAAEAWKKAFGSQDELTRIRSEYSRIVTPAAMAAYKTVAAGSTSDKDIETAMVGVPSDTDSPERMAAFLRGAAKLQIYGSVMNNAKAEWLGANKHLGKTSADVEIDGVKVPAGTTFKQFADQYVGKKAGQIAGASLVNSLAAKYGPQSGGATGGF